VVQDRRRWRRIRWAEPRPSVPATTYSPVTNIAAAWSAAEGVAARVQEPEQTRHARQPLPHRWPRHPCAGAVACELQPPHPGTGVLRGDELQHIRRGSPARAACPPRRRNTQVVRCRQHRVRRERAPKELQVPVQLRHTKPHNKITRCGPRTLQARIQPSHAGTLSRPRITRIPSR